MPCTSLSVNKQAKLLPVCALLLAAVCTCCFTLQAIADPRSKLLEDTTRYYQKNTGDVLKDLFDLLEIPSPSRNLTAVKLTAKHIQQQFWQRGVRMESLSLPGAPPLLVAAIDGEPETLTIGIYAHYDTQPVEPKRWLTNPYTPVVFDKSVEAGGQKVTDPLKAEWFDPNWRIYARGAGDDKHNIAALLTLARVLEQSGKKPTANIRIVLDGEEEIGSPHLESYREQFRDKFDDIDLWLFFDGPMHFSNRPQVVFGARGITGLEITVYGANRDLHSGHYGNWAPVPGQMLASLLASMKDRDGNVLVKDFYQGVAKLGVAEREAIQELAKYDEALRRELGFAQAEGGGQPLAQRIMLPSITIKGIRSGTTGAEAKNAIPGSATANLGIRLVEGIDSHTTIARVKDHVRRQGFHLVEAEPDQATRLKYPRIAKVTGAVNAYNASRASLDHPISKVVVAAVRSVSEEEMLIQPTSGGTLPLNKLKGGLKVPVLAIPTANYDNNQHAPNENIRLANLLYAIRVLAAVFEIEQ